MQPPYSRNDKTVKDAFYFPHDMNAQNDPKCVALIEDFGATGYGVYWVLIEMLHQEGGRLEKVPRLFKGMARRLQVAEELILKQIQAMLVDYKLIQEDKTHIWSERVLRNVEDRKQKRDVKVEAGRRGGLKSGTTRLTRREDAFVEEVGVEAVDSLQSKPSTA